MNNIKTLFEDKNILKRHLIARAKGLFKLEDTSCTKHTNRDSKRNVKKRFNGNKKEYGTLLFEEKGHFINKITYHKHEITQ